MSIPAKTIFIPDTMTNWPWLRVCNPYYAEVKAESTAWFHNFKAFSARSQYAFDKCDFALLAALCYPKATKEQLRSGCDMIFVFFAVYEYTDVEPQPVVREMIDIVVDALRNPDKPRPAGEIVLGEITRQFWGSAVKVASPSSQRHFMKSCITYLESVVQQAADRDTKTNHSIESYLKFRHDNIGMGPFYAVLEFGLNLSDEVFYHPTIVRLTECITKMILLDNDVASYNREQAVGDDRNNILTVVMRELGFDLDQAVDWVVKHHAELQKSFLDGLKQVPTWGADVNRQVHEYLDGVANWARGNTCWSFEGGRYFGDKSPEELRNRRIMLLPRITPPGQNATFRRENVIVPLIEDLESAA